MSIFYPLLKAEGLIDDIEAAGLPDPLSNRAFHQQILHEMIHAGMDLVRCLRQQTTDAILDRRTPPDNALAFERIARAVRRSIMLAARLDEYEPPASPATHPAPARPQAGAPHAPPPEAQDRPEQPDPADERPEPQAPADNDEDQPEPEDELDDEPLANRPVPEQIAALRRDLGLPPLAHPPLAQPALAQPALTQPARAHPPNAPSTPRPPTNAPPFGPGAPPPTPS